MDGAATEKACYRVTSVRVLGTTSFGVEDDRGSVIGSRSMWREPRESAEPSCYEK